MGIPTPAGQLAASVVCAGCGGPRHAQSGTISSPLNPDGNYGPRVECVWDISVLPGYHVNIAFDEPFGIEDSANCTNDYLQVAWHRQTRNWVMGHRVSGSCGSSFTFGSPVHHFDPVCDPSFSGFRKNYNCGTNIALPGTMQILLFGAGYKYSYLLTYIVEYSSTR